MRSGMAWITSRTSSASSNQMISSRLAAIVGSDREHSWRIRVGLEVDDHDCVVDRMEDRVVVDAVLVGRAVDLHTILL